MGRLGKWIGGGLGFVMGGPLGAVLGFMIGSMVDNTTIQTTTYTGTPQSTARGDFGMSLLVLVAAMMKADNKVVKSELDYVKQFFIRQFGQSTAREAVLTLKDILNQEIPVRDVCLQIASNMDYSSRLQLLHLLFGISGADGNVHALEVEAIEKMSGYLGISSSDFISIKNMFVPETDSSYKILEISPDSSDEEVKKAYRKMAMKYHPDKVSHLGEEFRKAADEKFKKVNEAYNRIKKERNIS
ncbi:MAG: TerB family tellurite resistance protein [Bacteroidales bacterium]|jgi:DnaJ like chaperone protein|nr:TerB family tellurite resistance protein [Bacteroidales bacterium]